MILAAFVLFGLANEAFRRAQVARVVREGDARLIATRAAAARQSAQFARVGLALAALAALAAPVAWAAGRSSAAAFALLFAALIGPRAWGLLETHARFARLDSGALPIGLAEAVERSGLPFRRIVFFGGFANLAVGVAFAFLLPVPPIVKAILVGAGVAQILAGAWLLFGPPNRSSRA